MAIVVVGWGWCSTSLGSLDKRRAGDKLRPSDGWTI
jgi:hypothetical protein